MSVRFLGYLLPALLINLLLALFIHRIVTSEPIGPALITGIQHIDLLSGSLPDFDPPAATEPATDANPPKPPAAGTGLQEIIAQEAPPLTRPAPPFDYVELPELPMTISSRISGSPYLGGFRQEPLKTASQPAENTAREGAAGQVQAAAPDRNHGAEANSSLQPAYRTPPVYPRRARRSGVEGTVTVEFTVTTEGRVSAPRIIRATPPGIFEQAVLRSISAWRFDPLPVEQRVVQDVNFSLTEK